MLEVRLTFKVGKRKFKLYDHEAALLHNEIADYFVGRRNSDELYIGKEIEGETPPSREIGFHE